MAYDPNNLSALSYANGFTLWHYKTPDLSADIDTTGYFNEAANMLRIGDFIMANTAINATVSSGVFIVRANSEIGVDVANISSFGLANTD
jgi:hypothetical protein